MKRLLLCLFIITTAFTLKNATKPESEKYKVEIWQDGKPVEMKDNIIVLQKKEFQFRIILKNCDGLLLSASTSKNYFKLKDSEPIPDLQYINFKVMAENDSINIDKEQPLDDDGLTYFYYSIAKKEQRGFDPSPLINGNEVTGTKTIKQFNVNETKKVVPVADFGKDLYLFFVAADKDDIGKMQDYGRTKLHIKWK